MSAHKEPTNSKSSLNNMLQNPCPSIASTIEAKVIEDVLYQPISLSIQSLLAVKQFQLMKHEQRKSTSLDTTASLILDVHDAEEKSNSTVSQTNDEVGGIEVDVLPPSTESADVVKVPENAKTKEVAVISNEVSRLDSTGASSDGCAFSTEIAEKSPQKSDYEQRKDLQWIDTSAKSDAVDTVGDDEVFRKVSNYNDDITERVDDERTYFEHTLFELGRREWHNTESDQRYTKGCAWSPDGTCILVPVHMDGMHVINLPQDIYGMVAVTPDRVVSTLSTALHVKEGGTVYDYAWYPLMSSDVPETCCWLSTRQHEPIHMWDAFTGELRCSYLGYDAVDEVETAISITFAEVGERILAGYKKSIKVFDTNCPGRNHTTVPVKQSVSCFALPATDANVVTTGSWNGYIYHHDLRIANVGPLFTLGGHSGGITWLRHASKQGSSMLFSGARKDNKILQYDLRNYKEPLRVFKRTVATNQRITFDLSYQQEWLVSGDTEGLLHIWDLCGENEDEKVQISLHKDCCNSAQFHPNLPILATTSGKYHFTESNIDDSDAVTADTTDSPPGKRTKPNENEVTINEYENSLLMLWFGGRAVEHDDSLGMQESDFN